MAKEPVKTKDPQGRGRPAISEEQYLLWLNELRPWLEMAMSLWGACGKSGLQNYYKTILQKYNLKDYFSQKVDAYRQSFGESINEALARETLRILDRTKKGELLDREEIRVLIHQSEHHRAAAPFFHNKQEIETVDEDKIGKIIETLEAEVNDYREYAATIEGQVMENDAPVQNQEQAGADSPVSTEQAPTEVRTE